MITRISGRISSTLIILALVLVATGACQPDPELFQTSDVEFSQADYALVGANVIPMTDAGPLADQTVLVRDGRISAIGPRSELEVPATFRRIEAAGRYLIPGLTDAHVHLEHFISPEVLKLFVANGITTVRNMDGRPYILEWRRAVESGAMLGPTIYTAGPILDGDPPTRDDNTIVRNVTEAAAVVEEQARAGYDFIKVYVGLSREVYDAVIASAQEYGLPVAGHVPRQVPLERVLEAGQASIEHLDGYDELIEAEDSPHRDGWHWSKLYLAMPADSQKFEEAAQLTAEAGIWHVPTLVMQEKRAAPSEMQTWLEAPELAYVPRDVTRHWDPDQWDRQTRDLLDNFGPAEAEILERGELNRNRLVAALHDARVGVLIGTDTPNPFVVPGFSVHEELRNFVEAGLSPHDALLAATRESARFLGEADQFGTIEVGKRADLILVDRDPTENIQNTTSIVGVMVHGAWLPARDLTTLLEEVAAAFQ